MLNRSPRLKFLKFFTDVEGVEHLEIRGLQLLVKLLGIALHIFVDSGDLGPLDNPWPHKPKVGNHRRNYDHPAPKDQITPHDDPEGSYPGYQVDKGEKQEENPKVLSSNA